MYANNIPTLRIGNLEINPPIIQGGMGIRVSGWNLAAAVANTGCAGVIASAGLGQFEDPSLKNCTRDELVKLNEEALRSEIRKARAKSDGVIGVNIMVALTDYANHVEASVDEGVDLIISGAGLPLALPQYADGKDVKLIPIVSSARTFQILCRRWKKHFDRLPDAVVVEGARAGGHLGYTYESVADGTADSLEKSVSEVVQIANSFDINIPVIAAGGIFDGNDIAGYLRLGASGVQMATRFVCTDECDVHNNFKQAYLDAKADDITIVKSPVGLPGRVINNSFVEKIKRGEAMPFRCNYQCLRMCEPSKAPYCIAEVLANAAKGNLDEGFVFAGSNAYRCNKIVPVKVLVESLIEELSDALAQESLCTD